MFCFAIFHILGWEPNMSQCNVHPYTSTANGIITVIPIGIIHIFIYFSIPLIHIGINHIHIYNVV